MRDSGDGFQPGPPKTRHAFFELVAAFRSRTVNFRAVLPSGSRLPLRRLSPTSIVGRPPRLLHLHARNMAPRSTICMLLTPSLAYLHAKAHFLLRLSCRSSVSVSSHSTCFFIQGSPLSPDLLAPSSKPPILLSVSWLCPADPADLVRFRFMAASLALYLHPLLFRPFCLNPFTCRHRPSL